MKFSKIDDATVRCVLSEEDMKEQGIEIEDFFKNKDKTQKFLEAIVEQAREEVGYEAESGMLAMQVMPLPENGLSIVFSENSEGSIKNMIQGMKDAVEDAAEEIQSTTQDKAKVKPNVNSKKPQIRSYCFKSLWDVESFCGDIPSEKKFKSRLYKNEADKKFYLVIEKGRNSAKLFHAVCDKALEFAEFVSDDPATAEFYQEHFTMILSKYAVNILNGISRS